MCSIWTDLHDKTISATLITHKVKPQFKFVFEQTREIYSLEAFCHLKNKLFEIPVDSAQSPSSLPCCSSVVEGSANMDEIQTLNDLAYDQCSVFFRKVLIRTKGGTERYLSCWY